MGGSQNSGHHWRCGTTPGGGLQLVRTGANSATPYNGARVPVAWCGSLGIKTRRQPQSTHSVDAPFMR